MRTNFVRRFLVPIVVVSILPTGTANGSVAGEPHDTASLACAALAGGPELVADRTVVLNPGMSGVFRAVVELRSGDLVRVVGSGSIDFDGSLTPAGSWGPAGNGILSPDASWSAYVGNSSSENSAEYSLYGYFGRNGQPIRVGVDSGCRPYTATGGTAPDTFGVGINDMIGAFGDNTGVGFTARVRVYRPVDLSG